MKTLLLTLAVFAWPLVAFSADCNVNDVDDEEDIASGLSTDCNDNSVPDECEFLPVAFGQPLGDVPLSASPLVPVVGDLNGDGLLDVVTASRTKSRSTARVFVLLNEGDARLAPAAEYDPGLDLHDLDVSDADGDNDLDVLVIDTTSVVRTLANDGAGNFTPSSDFATTAVATSVEAVDLNGDSFDDLLVVSPSKDTIAWGINRGDGSFTSGGSLSVGDLPVAAVGADFDGDGGVDLAIGTVRGAEIEIYRQQDDGHFVPQLSLPLGKSTKDVAAADLDGDGLPDLAASGLKGLRIHFSEGETGFTAATILEDPLSRLLLDDVDGDGFVDVLAADFIGKGMPLYLGDGSGALAPPQRFLLEFTSFTAADLDVDGDLDLVLSADEPDRISVLRNGEQPPLLLERFDLQVLDRPHYLDTGDFNRDGHSDIVTVNGGDRSYTVFLGHGDGTFTAGAKYVDEQHPAWSVQVADFDGNGIDDQVHRDNTEINVLFGLGDGTFSERVGYLVANGFNYLLATDVDEDGHVDVVAPAVRTVNVHYNDGAGKLIGRQGYPCGRLPVDVVAGDFDADGLQDLVTSNHTSSDVSLLLREEGRTFRAAITLAVGDGPIGLGAIDLDGDGDLDLATSNDGSIDISVLLNEGGAVFSPARTFALERSPRALFAADLDGDGFGDLIATNEKSSSLTILRGLGGGELSLPQQFPVDSGPRVTAGSDLDGDGDVDLVVAGRVGTKVSVVLNKQPARDRDFASLPRICTARDMEKVAVKGGGTPVLARASFLLPAQSKGDLLPPLFPDLTRFPQLSDFLTQLFPERFPTLGAAELTALVGRRAERTYFTGSIRRLRTETGIVYGFDVVTATDEPAELLTAAETLAVREQLAEVFTLRPLVYAPSTRAAFDAAADWGDAGPPLGLFDELVQETIEPSPRSSPEFELVIPADTVLCGIFLEADAGRGLPEEYTLKSTVSLRAGRVALPTENDTFEADLFEDVTFGPRAAPAAPLGRGTFRITRIPAADQLTTYRFTYSQEFALDDQRLLEVAIVSPLQYRARGDEPIEQDTSLPESFFVTINGREGVQASIDGAPLVHYGSCTYDALPRWDVDFELAGGHAVHLREHFEEAASEFETGPAALRRAQVRLGTENRTVSDYFQLVYSAGRHNTSVEYWVLLEPPLRVDGQDVHGLELQAPEAPFRPAPLAFFLDRDLRASREIEVSAFRRTAAAMPRFRRGDADGDGSLTILDALHTLDLLFRGAPAVTCAKAADANDDGRLNIVDPITFVGTLFGERALPSPFPGCGEDATVDTLGCDRAAPCE